MSKDNRADNAKSIVKRFQKTREIEKKVALSKKKLRAECMHRRNGRYELIKKESRNGAPTEWYCKLCDAKIELRQIDQKKLQDAIDTVYQACNLVKLTARPDVSEKDANLVDMVSDIMFRLDAFLPQMYAAALTTKGNNKGNKSQPKRGGVIWDRAGSM